MEMNKETTDGDHRVHLDTNSLPQEELQSSSPFLNDIYYNNMEVEPESRTGLKGNHDVEPNAYVENKEHHNDEEEGEMILGDIPDVSIPPVLRDYAALLEASTKTGERSSKSKKTTTKGTVHEPTKNADHGSLDQLNLSSRRYACRKCSLIFSKLEFLEAHMTRLHPVVGPFRCTECAFETKFHSMYLLHLKEPHAPEAKKENIKFKRVKISVRPRNPVSRMKCPICPYDAGSLAEFSNHSRIAHKNEFGKVHNRDVCETNDKYGCPHRPPCSFQAPNRDILEEHYKTEHNQRLWHCGECDFYTIWKGGISKHTKAHRDKSAHACEYCGETFSLLDYLNQHRTGCNDSKRQQHDLIKNVNDIQFPANYYTTSTGTSGLNDMTSEERTQEASSTLGTSLSSMKPVREFYQQLSIEGAQDLKIKRSANSAIENCMRVDGDCNPVTSFNKKKMIAEVHPCSKTKIGQAVQIASLFHQTNANDSIIALSNSSTDEHNLITNHEMEGRYQNRHVMNVGLQASPGPNNFSDDIEVIELTDDTAQDGCLIDRAAKSQRENVEVKTCTLGKNVSFSPQPANTNSLFSCEDSASVTIVWDSKFTGKITCSPKELMEAKTNTDISTLKPTSDNSIYGVSQVDVPNKKYATTDKYHSNATSADKNSTGQILDLRTERKPMNLKAEKFSNEYLASNENGRRSSCFLNCDTRRAPSSAPKILTGYRETSPPPLVIDNSSLSD